MIRFVCKAHVSVVSASCVSYSCGNLAMRRPTNCIPKFGIEVFIFSIVAFNRDEDVSRPTVPMERWQPDADCSALYSGRDGLRGGTWLAISEDGTEILNWRVVILPGRFCAVTNNRERPYPHDVAVSRGALVVDFFRFKSMEAFEGLLFEDATLLANANFVYGDFKTGDFHWYGVHDGQAQGNRCIDLMAGTFVIANGGIDAHWAKEERGRELFDTACKASKEHLIGKLLAALNDRKQSPMATSPRNTTLPAEIEHRISSIHIDAIDYREATYATLSSTIILVDHQDKCSVTEYTWYPEERQSVECFDIKM